MKAGAYLINTARKQLVDNEAVLAAIRAKRVAGYAIDDVIMENDKGLEYGRLLQSYHTGWYSQEALERGMEQWTNNIISVQERLKTIY
jgi:lactate dehydrogenase-like 2-hydroxyacid dehydrogenase